MNWKKFFGADFYSEDERILICEILIKESLAKTGNLSLIMEQSSWEFD